MDRAKKKAEVVAIADPAVQNVAVVAGGAGDGVAGAFVGSAVRPLHVGVDQSGASGSKKRNLDEIVECYTDSESDGELEYVSDGSVDDRNVKSFKEKLGVKLQNAEGIYNGTTNNGRYRCPFHLNKPPTGLFVNLVQHANEKARTGRSRKEREVHEVLAEYLGLYI